MPIRFTSSLPFVVPSILLVVIRVFESFSGVQEGDPLGPLYFCCGLQPIIDRITALAPTYQKWYMDDGGIVGPQDLLLKVWEILKTDGPPLGLHLNPTKCEWS